MQFAIAFCRVVPESVRFIYKYISIVVNALLEKPVDLSEGLNSRRHIKIKKDLLPIVHDNRRTYHKLLALLERSCKHSADESLSETDDV